MAADIVLSPGVRSNLLQLQKTSELITATQSKLSTGKRVNTALDNPINYFTSQGLQNRASDFGNLLDIDVDRLSTPSRPPTTASPRSPSWCSPPRRSPPRRCRPRTPRSAPCLATQFDAIRLADHQLAGDAGFNGINLLDTTNSSDLTSR